MLGRGTIDTMSFRRLGGRALALEHFGAAKPSLRHPAPCCPTRGVARELGHPLAVGGVPEKFLGWIHRPVLQMIRLRRTSPRGETVPRIGKAAANTGPVHARSSVPSRRPIAPRIERIRSLAADTHPCTHPWGPWRFALTCAPPPLCPLMDIRSTAIGAKGSPAAGPACHRSIPARAAQVPRIWLRQWNNEKLRGVSRMGSRDQAMDREDADVRHRIRAGVRESPRTDAGDGDCGTPAPPRRGAVYVDEAIWEWRGLTQAPPPA